MLSAMLSVLLFFTSCERDIKPVGIDPNNRPQAEGRDKLRDELGSLTAIPSAGANRVIQLIQRGRFFQDHLGVFITTKPQPDTGKWQPRVELYRWTQDALQRVDTLTLGVVTMATTNVNNDPIDDLLCYTIDTLRRPGLALLSTDAESGRMRYLFRIDSIRPVFYKLDDNTYGLIQYDSLVDWSVRSHHFPKRLFRVESGVYARKAFDSTWLKLVRYMRDSIQQSFQLEREQVRGITGAVSYEQTQKYLRALGGLTVLNPSWINARSFLSAEKSFMSGHLSPTAIGYIDRLLALPKVGPFVEAANTPAEEQQIILLAEFDESFGRGDQQSAALVLVRLAHVLQDQATIERVTELASLPGNTLVLVDAARQFWSIISSRYPNAAIAYRRWGILERRLGNEDTAQVLLRRSLMLDSTSREALEIRQSLPY